MTNFLGLTSFNVLYIPGFGLLIMLYFWSTQAVRWLQDRLAALLLTILLGTIGGILTITACLGVNAAWFLISLVTLAAGSETRSLVLSSLLSPWIDERFLLGWPLAMFCRWCIQVRPTPYTRIVFLGIGALLPYIFIRLRYSCYYGD